jgi:DNA repair photolyase
MHRGGFERITAGRALCSAGPVGTSRPLEAGGCGPRRSSEAANEALPFGEEKAKLNSMIHPGVPAPSLARRLGTEVVRERGGVVYRELETRSLVNRCDSPRVPFEWTVNPYRGCAIGCRYCYAAYTHEYLGLEAGESFHSAIYVKTGGLDESTRRLLAIARRGERVALGTATDPYQPGEAHLRVTRRFLECAAQLRGLRLGITTKGAIILRDVDLLQRIHERSRLSVQVSLNSLDAELLRRTEPWAPPPEARIEVLRRLAEAGLRVGLSLSPILPGLTDREGDLDALVGRAAAAGVRRMWASLLFLRSPTKEKYFEFLAREFPRYLEAYRRAYAGSSRLSGRYRERLEEIVRRLREKHGLEREDAADGGAYAPAPVQLDLFSRAPEARRRATFGYRLLA